MDFHTAKIGKWTIQIDKNLDDAKIKEILPLQIDAAFFNENAEPVPASEFARVYKCHAMVNGKQCCYYAKQFLDRSILDRAKHIFRNSRAKRFFQASLMLQRDNFATPKLVGVGEYRSFGICRKSFVITEEIKHSKSLYQAVNQCNDIKRLAEQLGNTIGRMHQNGISHGDLRAGNILVAEQNGKFNFFFLDNERTRKFTKLPYRLRIKNLVQLNMPINSIISNIDKLRFFKEYLKLNLLSIKNHKILLNDIIEKTREKLAGSKKVITMKTKNYNCYIDRAFFGDIKNQMGLNDFIDSLNRLIEDGQMIKTDRKTCVSVAKTGSSAIVIKRYNNIGFAYSIRQTLFQTRALKSWQFAHILLKIDIPTPRPLVCVEIKKNGLISQSYIITEFFNGENLHQYIVNHNPDDEHWQAIVLKIKTIIDKMGQSRITHGDLKHSNILLKQQAIAITDLDAMKIHKFPLFYKIKRTKDLQSFNNRLSLRKLKYYTKVY